MNVIAAGIIAEKTAIIFDMDGVIINSEILKAKAYEDVFSERYRIEIDRADIAWRGKPENEVVKYWAERYAMKLSKNEIIEIIRSKRNRYKELLRSGELKLVTGIEEFLKKIKKEGKIIALATTSSREDQEYVFNKYAILPYFDFVTTLDDIEKPKPDPEIYLKSIQKLYKARSEIVVFEDTPSGVEAAEAAGLDVICILTSFRKEDFENRTACISNYNEVL